MEKRYAVVKEWTTAKGLHAVCLRTDLGHLCGYVGVPRGNPLYGHGYDDNLPELITAWKRAKRGPIGKRGIMPLLTADDETTSMCCVFNVHGGITYASGGKNGYPSETHKDLWWIGFDCAHCDDTPENCDLPYVTAECENLADQIAAVLPFEKGR